MTTNKPLVIQLLGQARSGKDFTATALKSSYEAIGKSVEIMSYAAPMKQIVATLFDISLESLDYFKNHSDTVSIEVYDNAETEDTYQGHSFMLELDFRKLLQRMGNEAIKPIFGDDVWANLAQQHINRSSADIIIIPDCRFNVELSIIGGVTVRVLNFALPTPMPHASELELAGVQTDYELDNTNYKVTQQDIIDLAQRILHEY